MWSGQVLVVGGRLGTLLVMSLAVPLMPTLHYCCYRVKEVREKDTSSSVGMLPGLCERWWVGWHFLWPIWNEWLEKKNKKMKLMRKRRGRRRRRRRRRRRKSLSLLVE